MDSINEKVYEVYEKPNWLRRHVIETVIIIGGLLAINLIFIADVYRETNTVNAENAAHLGDFVGGFIGTIFTLISVVLLYSTLRDQRESSHIEKFENKYFELIKMHRDNVTEFGAEKYSGKKLFVLMIREFRLIQKIVKQIAETLSLEFSSKEVFAISYYVLFIGVGPNSSRMLRKALVKYGNEFAEALIDRFSSHEVKAENKSERKLEYTPFEGHQSRLGHYFRHLLQAIAYVDNQKIDIDKYEYVKTIRAQLSTHEQALLFINSQNPIGKAWEDQALIRRYRLVKNIPQDFFDPENEIDITEGFPKDYFEWQEPSDPQS
ncbi:putative phage abortive infection protein [Dyadobacter sp. CY326]|uniref:putative phage abortive infection protein n=1 Tax=Dyadobacter sp. CY326 TaxID=2907300 RepID=UPI001F48C0BE|nr:putative phage abortive infection protein [Dyadobacter sp. CY326]MCE7064010.1 putative phage abortive infection protein [Dyadobacter sp. CY326]